MKNHIFLTVSDFARGLPYYLYGAGSRYDQESIDRAGCRWYQLILCSEGEGELVLGSEVFSVTPGKGIFLYPEIPHKYFASRGRMIVSWIAFDGFQVGPFLKSCGLEESGLYDFHRPQDIHDIVAEALSIEELPEIERAYAGSNIVYRFLLGMHRNYRRKGEDLRTTRLGKLKPALDFMEQNLENPIGIEDIAGAMGMTPQHVCLLFRKILGHRPFEYLNALRIRYSKDLLVGRPELTVREVGRLAGYPSMSYFCQMFRRHERISPGKFRELYR